MILGKSRTASLIARVAFSGPPAKPVTIRPTLKAYVDRSCFSRVVAILSWIPSWRVASASGSSLESLAASGPARRFSPGKPAINLLCVCLDLNGSELKFMVKAYYLNIKPMWRILP